MTIHELVTAVAAKVEVHDIRIFVKLAIRDIRQYNEANGKLEKYYAMIAIVDNELKAINDCYIYMVVDCYIYIVVNNRVGNVAYKEIFAILDAEHMLTDTFYINETMQFSNKTLQVSYYDKLNHAVCIVSGKTL